MRDPHRGGVFPIPLPIKKHDGQFLSRGTITACSTATVRTPTARSVHVRARYGDSSCTTIQRRSMDPPRAAIARNCLIKGRKSSKPTSHHAAPGLLHVRTGRRTGRSAAIRSRRPFIRQFLVRRSLYAVYISTRTVPTLFASNRSTYAGCYLYRI